MEVFECWSMESEELVCSLLSLCVQSNAGGEGQAAARLIKRCLNLALLVWLTRK